MQANEFARDRKPILKGSELASSMAVVIAEKLRNRSIDGRIADEIALEVLDEVRKQYGGQNVYFAQEKRIKREELYEAIYDRYSNNELSISQIAQEYKFSLVWAYHIIRIVRTRRRQARNDEADARRQRDVERWKREGGNGDAS